MKVKAPKKVVLTASKPTVTKPVKLLIQNRGSHVESITDFSLLAQVTDLSIRSVEGECEAPVPVLSAKNKLPLVLKPRQKKSVLFDVTFDCANDPRQGVLHMDWAYEGSVFQSPIDRSGDSDFGDNVCPRVPLALLTSPIGHVKDKGCGMKLERLFRPAIVTDVVVR